MPIEQEDQKSKDMPWLGSVHAIEKLHRDMPLTLADNPWPGLETQQTDWWEDKIIIDQNYYTTEDPATFNTIHTLRVRAKDNQGYIYTLGSRLALTDAAAMLCITRLKDIIPEPGFALTCLLDDIVENAPAIAEGGSIPLTIYTSYDLGTLYQLPEYCNEKSTTQNF